MSRTIVSFATDDDVLLAWLLFCVVVSIVGALLTILSPRVNTEKEERRWQARWGVPMPKAHLRVLVAEYRLTGVVHGVTLLLLALHVLLVHDIRRALPLGVGFIGAIVFVRVVMSMMERRVVRQYEANLRLGPACLACAYPLRTPSFVCSECGSDWTEIYASHGDDAQSRPTGGADE